MKILYHSLILLSVLLAVGSALPAPAADDTQALYRALLNNDEAQVKALVTRNPALLECHYAGQTPLHLAAGRGNRKIVRFLLSRGAAAEVKDPAGVTPLHLAAQSGNADTVEVLLKAGAQVNAADDTKKTPLTYAILGGKKDAERILRKYGAREDQLF